MFNANVEDVFRVRAEPRLGWNWIPFSERNAWNDVLSRVLADKVRNVLVFLGLLTLPEYKCIFCFIFDSREYMFVVPACSA